MKFLHRDDVPYQVVEKLERALKEKVGRNNIQIKFAGDHENELSDEHRQKVEKFLREMHRKVREGICDGCGEVIPGFSWAKRQPNPLPEGWDYFRNPHNGTISSWRCPECSKEDGDGPIRMIEVPL